MRVSLTKLPAQEWHAQNGEMARQINELLQNLVVETQSQYKCPSWEYQVIKTIADLFRVWRNRLDRNQHKEILDRNQRSFWLGRANKFE